MLIFISIELTLSAQTNNRINIEFKDEALSTALKKLEKFRVITSFLHIVTYSPIG